MKNKPYFTQILQFTMQSGDSKAFVATVVATERMWLDTPPLKHSFFPQHFGKRKLSHPSLKYVCQFSHWLTIEIS
jgi:hypothetical protein